MLVVIPFLISLRLLETHFLFMSNIISAYIRWDQFKGFSLYELLIKKSAFPIYGGFGGGMVGQLCLEAFNTRASISFG